MGRGGLLKKYKMLIEMLGVKQVDVYRLEESESGGVRVKDVIRVFDPTTSKVITIDLGTVRESLSFGEFAERVLKTLKENGVRVSERVEHLVIDTAKKLDERYHAAVAEQT